MTDPARPPVQRLPRSVAAISVFVVACIGGALAVGALGSLGRDTPRIDPIVLVTTTPTTAPPETVGRATG
jgi:hypothetical protein